MPGSETTGPLLFRKDLDREIELTSLRYRVAKRFGVVGEEVYLGLMGNRTVLRDELRARREERQSNERR